MLDAKTLRNDPQAVAEALEARGYTLDVDAYEGLEARRRELQSQTESLQQKRNESAKAIGKAKQAGEDIQPLLDAVATLGDELKAAETELSDIQQQLQDLYLELPNLAHPSVPAGMDENDNLEVRRWGEPRAFDFKPRDHVDLGEALGGLDFAAGAKLSGSRFVVMQDQVARLHRALAQFMLDTHTREHGYRETYVPYLVDETALLGTGQLPKFAEDLFAIANFDRNLHLIPTAEVPLTNLAADSHPRG